MDKLMQVKYLLSFLWRESDCIITGVPLADMQDSEKFFNYFLDHCGPPCIDQIPYIWATTPQENSALYRLVHYDWDQVVVDCIEETHMDQIWINIDEHIKQELYTTMCLPKKCKTSLEIK